MEQIKFKQQTFRKVKFLKLEFPELTFQEEEKIRAWAKFCNYQCTIDRTAKRFIISNKNNRIAYIQKINGDIRLAFNAKWESISYAIGLVPIFERMREMRQNGYENNTQMDSLLYSHLILR